ncbi:MAG TPA: hypothetical protein VFY39_11825 [Gammaproteobacteria bacterium]|nr:hypothetical protein [Gammaproteobacteria bacterium]
MKLVLPLLLALAASGCQTTEPAAIGAPQIDPVQGAPSSELAELSKYGNMVRELGGKQLEQQYHEIALGGNSTLSSEAAIKLSLLLSAPNAAFQDIDQAARFLRDVAYRESGEEPQIAEFARLLYNLLRERVYSDTNQDADLALLSKERDRNEQLSRELAKVKNALALERKQRETLESQLDALKRLEEQLSREGLGR